MKDLILNGANELNIKLDDDKIKKLIRYKELLQEWSMKMNLTAIKDDEGIITKHFLDSMSAFKTGNVKGRVIDIGTGAGFPGLVLKIVEPKLELTLLDSLNKRITFLKAVCDELNISDVTFIHGRAEDFAMMHSYRESFDTAVSRAVSRMENLAQWCIPYLKQGGHFLALKGPLANDEVNEAKRIISILGGELLGILAVDIPYTDLNHKIVNIKKVRQTPMRYPKKPIPSSKLSVEQCYKLKK